MLYVAIVGSLIVATVGNVLPSVTAMIFKSRRVSCPGDRLKGDRKPVCSASSGRSDRSVLTRARWPYLFAELREG